ncbi:MAG: hypothetical protein DDT26_01047 [Dehalococcoidia bacterium]|nr:hypothetical protein [Chloroflexota bacterium]
MQTPLDLAAQIALIEQTISLRPDADWTALKATLDRLRRLAGIDPVVPIKGQSLYGRVKPKAKGDREATNALVLELNRFEQPTVRVR